MGTISTQFASSDDRTFFGGTEVTPLTTSVKLASGQGVLYKGALLGKVTESGDYKLVDGTAEDGSEVALFVLATPEVDTSTTDLVAVAYKTGIFNRDALYVAEGDAVDKHADELREVNIHYKTDY
ncbi:head decoration protein [Paenibacillaceae bacterium]|nr:head decoration protein [Paenibacillaceae bacterium]